LDRCYPDHLSELEGELRKKCEGRHLRKI